MIKSLLGADLLLHKSPVGRGFHLLEPDFTIIPGRYSFVIMKGITLEVHPDRIDPDRWTVHGVARGIVQAYLPEEIPGRPLVYGDEYGEELAYDKLARPPFFYLKKSGKKVVAASYLLAHNNEVRLQL